MTMARTSQLHTWVLREIRPAANRALDEFLIAQRDVLLGDSSPAARAAVDATLVRHAEILAFEGRLLDILADLMASDRSAEEARWALLDAALDGAAAP